MPRTRRLIRMDDREVEIRRQVGAIMGEFSLSIPDLAKQSGINERTLRNRIGPKGDIGSMKLSELWMIQDAGENLRRYSSIKGEGRGK